jgi:hypothetical protein
MTAHPIALAPPPDVPGQSLRALPCSGRRPRRDRLLHYGVDVAHAKVVKERIGPLTRYYWHRQGLISIEELCMSAYIQGMMDAEQLKK